MVSAADSMAATTVAANSDTHTATPTNHSENVKPTPTPSTPIDYQSFQSPFAQRLRPSAIRSLYPLASKPGMLSLFAGLPNPSQFPIKAMKFTLTDDTEFEFTQKELEWSLQYSATGGQPDLNALWKQMLIEEHQPAYPHDQLQVVVGHGSQDLCCKAIQCYVDAGEIVLIDDFSYPGAVQYLQTIGADLVGIENDEQGMRIDVLRETCERLKQQNKRIKCMYIVPTGGNPTGYTVPTARRRQIYEIACQYNFLIIEDEPYYYLTFGSAPAPATLEEFRRPQPEQSFFSMDREGRVIRLDSLSKTFSAGLRVGFVAGAAPLIAPIFQLHSGTTLFSNGPSQVITLKALQHLGRDGFNKHIDAVSYFYCKRRDTFWAAFQKHLGSTGLATAVSPVAGMFLWIKIEGIDDSYDLILKDAVEKLVLLVPGRGFSCDPTCKTPFVRAAFSIADESCFDEAMRRLAELIKEHKVKLQNQEERKQ